MERQTKTIEKFKIRIISSTIENLEFEKIRGFFLITIVQTFTFISNKNLVESYF
jgi:hypothetical protein